jgi:hypothetical protein
MIMIWMGLAIGIGALIVFFLTTWRGRGQAVELGNMSEQWVGEQKMNDRSYDR